MFETAHKYVSLKLQHFFLCYIWAFVSNFVFNRRLALKINAVNPFSKMIE